MTDILSFHMDYLMKHKITDISLDITGIYIQAVLSECGIKMSAWGIKVLIFTLIAIL